MLLNTTVFFKSASLYLFIGCAFLWTLLSPDFAFAGKKKVAVFFPQYPAPYNTIYEDIISGIQHDKLFDFRLIPVNEGESAEAEQIFKDGHFDGAITLGQRGLDVFQTDPIKPVVSGGIAIIPDHVSGISLSVAPNQMFSKLQSLYPAIRKLFVVYSEEASGAIMPLARTAAAQRGIELITLEAFDLRDALTSYRHIFNQVRQGDAIWLPLDWITVEDRLILPMLLKESWNKRIALISSKPGHTRSGTVFAIFPNNFGLGEELAQTLILKFQSPDKRFASPASKVDVAVNTRSAAHLGLDFSRAQKNTFDLIFPLK